VMAKHKKLVFAHVLMRHNLQSMQATEGSVCSAQW